MEIQGMCEGFEARDQARQEINTRMMQTIKGGHEKEVNSMMEQIARYEVELGKHSH